MSIKEKVKKFIIEQNARQGVGGSGSGDADAPPTHTADAPAVVNTGAPSENIGQDGVEH